MAAHQRVLTMVWKLELKCCLPESLQFYHSSLIELLKESDGKSQNPNIGVNNPNLELMRTREY